MEKTRSKEWGSHFFPQIQQSTGDLVAARDSPSLTRSRGEHSPRPSVTRWNQQVNPHVH